MRRTTALLAAVAVGSLVAAGGAFADQVPGANGQPKPQAAVEKDFGKLSADGSKAFQDLTLARLAIYDGDTATAKTAVDAAAAAFAKAKGDDTVFMKAERQLVTPQDMAAHQAAKQPQNATANATTAKETAAEQTVTMTEQGQQAQEASHSPPDQTNAPATSGSAASAQAAKVAWLPVDATITLDKDYAISPAKSKAVADANKSLAGGDSKGALDQLKVADVNLNVMLEVLPLKQTIDDVHQAASLIDAGKYYEGSQILRNVQASARYDVTDYLATPGGKLATSHASDAGSAATTH